MSSNFSPNSTMKNWKKTGATFGTVEMRLVLHVLLLILGGDGALIWLRIGSLVEVSSVHSCTICDVRSSRFFRTLTPQRMGSRSRLLVPLYPFRCTSPRSSQFRVTNHGFMDLVGNDRSIMILSDTTLPRVVGHEMLFLCVCFAVPSTVGSLLLDDVVRDGEHPIAIDENLGLIRFLSRDVHKCDRSLLVPNKECILIIALSELFRLPQISPVYCPCHESSSLSFHQMGCRRHSAASRPEVLVDEDESQWKISSCCVNKPMDCPLLTSLSVLISVHVFVCVFVFM